MVGGDPIGVVSGGGGHGSAGGALFGDLGLRALRGLSALLTGLSGGLALLGEVGRDPNRVEEVTGADNTGKKEDVEEDTERVC